MFRSRRLSDNRPELHFSRLDAMSKLLFWIILLAIAWLVVRVLIAKGRDVSGPAGDTDHDRPFAGNAQSVKGDPPEAMRQCAYCGVYFPASDAVTGSDGRVYCGRAHHDAAGRAGSE